MSFETRSTALIDLLTELHESDHEYVLVGGYAVSVFSPRFSTDLDLVVAHDDKGGIIEFLESRDFEQTDAHNKHWEYDTEVIQYEKRLAPRQPIGVDVLVNGLGCRQTGAQWSFQYLLNNSRTQTVAGGTTQVPARVVEGSVLVAAKLHSGRETDLRDVLAITEHISLPEVSTHLQRGDHAKVRQQLERGLDILASDDLKHSFRSDFGVSTVTETALDSLQEFIRAEVARLND